MTPMERATSDLPENVKPLKLFCVHFALQTLRYKQSLKACTECPKPKIDLEYPKHVVEHIVHLPVTPKCSAVSLCGKRFPS